MKTISKALIAVMVAAAMCLVPVFAVADDSAAAATLEEEESGISFKASSISDEKYNGFVTDDYNESIAYSVLGLVFNSLAFTVEDLSVTDVKDVKASDGTKVTADEKTVTGSMEMTCKISFKATYMGIAPIEFFGLYDDTQGLYDYLGSNYINNGNSITFNGGKLTMKQSGTVVNKIALDDAKDYVSTKITTKDSNSFSYSGEVKLNNGTVKIFDLDRELTGSSNVTYSYDYLGTEVKDVTGATKVRMTVDSDTNTKTVFKYSIKGEGSGGYKFTDSPYANKPNTYVTANVSDMDDIMDAKGLEYLFTGTIDAPNYSFYNTYGIASFFDESDVKADYRSNDATKAFLDEVGSTDTTYSEAKSISDSVYTQVSAPANGGSNNIIFYVVIGVLAVAVLALAVLAFKKK